MSFMDQALSHHQYPSPEALEVVLPPRRDPKKREETPTPELGQHGGTSAASGAGDGQSDSAVAVDPQPQRDEPDEGEHTDSTEEQVASRAQRTKTAAAEVTDQGEENASGQDPEQAATPVMEPVAPAAAPEQNEQRLEGSTPRVFKRVGASYGDVPVTHLKRFPQPAADTLRAMLARSTGTEFAESISIPAMVTAFLMAHTGLHLEVDENTAAAAQAFRDDNPRLSRVEDRVEETLENIDQLAGALKLGLRRIADTATIAENLEFGVSFLVGDRVARMATPEIDETSVKIVQKKTLIVRERMRAQAKAQRTIEKQNEGRSNT